MDSFPDPPETHWTWGYWSGERPHAAAPLTAWVPYFALHRARAGYSPATHSVALQRSVSRTFRREALVSHHPALPPDEATSVADDEHGLSGAARAAVVSWPTPQAARFLGRLGFHQRAWDRIRALPQRDGHGPLIEALLRRIAVSHYLVESGTSAPFVEAIGQLADYLSWRSGSSFPSAQLRPAALAVAKATVHHGVSGDTGSCARWAAHATELARHFRGTEFETLLLRTRVERAQAFLPYLERRYDRVVATANTLLEDAARLTTMAGDEDEALLARENQLAAHETTSRMFEAAGDSAKARQVLETAAWQVDPVDPKLHLHLGDFHRRQGETSSALARFTTAGALDAPYSRVGWYSAGFLHEEQQRFHDAIGAYLLSLSYWPEGISAHAGIVRSARRIGLSEDDYRFARSAIERVTTSPQPASRGDSRGGDQRPRMGPDTTQHR